MQKLDMRNNMRGKKSDFKLGEDILFETRPSIFIHSKSILIKLIVLFIFIYLFRYLVNFLAFIQNNLVSIIRVPLVEIGVIITILIIFFLILWMIWDLTSWWYIRYTLTDHRIVIQKGLIRKKRAYIHYNKIQDISVEQSFFQRLAFCGNIEVYGGRDRAGLFLESIPNPTEAENMINQMIEEGYVKFKKRRRPDKETVINKHSKKFKRKL
jgi:membrane protein YdbS with pleckstrin-like domain